MKQPELSPIEQLASENWGTYYLSRYYFSIQTTSTRRQAGLTRKKLELSMDEQWALQKENLPALFHEFFHYLHEVSTVASNAIMLNRITMKSIFTEYMSMDVDSAESFGSKAMPDKSVSFVNAWKTNEILEGSLSLEFSMRRIETIVPTHQEVFFEAAAKGSQQGMITLPEITYSGFLNGRPATAKIMLGRLYIYECLAYEMDQIIDRRQRKLANIADPLRNSEYTVCRMVAQYIFPEVRQEIAMAAALLALQHINSGHAFIQFLQQIGDAHHQGISQDVIIDKIKRDVSQTLQAQRANNFVQQDIYAGLFTGRQQLAIAYTHIAAINKSMYDLRIQNPCFELDWILEGKYDRIFDAALICDYLYIFKNKKKPGKDPEFDRDFMATMLPEKISVALKALISFDHYFLAHKGAMPSVRVEADPQESHRCPFFTCCHLKDRKENTELCHTKPWRIYEIQRRRDKRFCWYATGVLEAKGPSVRTSTI